MRKMKSSHNIQRHAHAISSANDFYKSSLVLLLHANVIKLSNSIDPELIFHDR